MPDKTPIKKVNKKTARKKINLVRLLLIFFAVIIALSFLLFSIFTPKRNKPTASQSFFNSKSAPSFRKDGSLSIFLTKNPSPIILDIEIADNDQERMRGLMDRQNLPDNAGMLFVFSNDEPRSFWMKNTFISLDIIYINSRKEIVSIQKYTQPKSTYSIPSEKPARYVLEVNAGFTDKYGIKPGDKIDYFY
ncbi:MAG: DUF192 domain-containing protein [Bacteroidales bacterium]|nr:DUF192 domain-containing protein [Bacteroidales bacterium]